MRVTLKDIAAEAGVSVMTVSNVINGKGARVSPQTAERIQAIVLERGYIPNGQARSLAAKASRVIGMLIPAAGEDTVLASPHNAAMIGWAEHRLRELDYHLVLRGVNGRRDVERAVHEWNLDGALLLGFLDEEIDDLRDLDDVPMLAIDSYATNPSTTGVRSDDFGGGRIAAAHLLDLGHREIVFAGPEFTEKGVVRQRFDGFREALAERGVAWTDASREVANTTYADGRLVGLAFRQRHPNATAIFATADILAIGIMAGLAETGVRVPADVSVVGFDNLDLGAFVTPKLTTVGQDIPEKASVAVDLLIDAAEGGPRSGDPVTLGVELVVRDTTAPAID